jgi:GT2 family glycosyltransferase
MSRVTLRATVIIPSWNAAEVLGDCLDSLAAQKLDGGFETIVVDNASTDATAEVLHAHRDEVRVISNDENVGFSVANNEAADVARGRVLFFLNSDTRLLDPETLERVVRVAETPEVGIAGPTLLNPDGTLQPSCAGDPTITGALLLGTGAWRLVPAQLRRRRLPQLWPHDRSIDTDWVKGAAMAMRAEVFEAVGGFWPRLYGEEQDIAFRVRRSGLAVRFVSDARIVHVGNFSLRQRQSDSERAARIAAAELAFLASHYPPARAATIRAIAGAGHAARALVHAVIGNRAEAGVYRALAAAYARGARGPAH